jgi:hypothetical protein
VLYANCLAFQCRSPIAARILSPDGETTILPGTPILLQGYAYDLEDGVLEESALQWSSSRDGSLGGGSQVLVTLSAGQHVVTLAAEDSDSNTAKASVQVDSRYRRWLPIAFKNYS